jgi:hypothetical protein
MCFFFVERSRTAQQKFVACIANDVRWNERFVVRTLPCWNALRHRPKTTCAPFGPPPPLVAQELLERH